MEIAAAELGARAVTLSPGKDMWTLEHRDGVVMVSHVQHDVHGIHSPQELGGATCMLNVTVDDVDAHFARAVAAGATVTMEVSDAFFGERRYEAADPEGNRWHFGEPIEHARARRGL
jgi:PhnB protein